MVVPEPRAPNPEPECPSSRDMGTLNIAPRRVSGASRRFPRYLLWGLLACAALPPQVSLADDSVTGDALVVGSIGDASRLLPLLASDSASGDIVGLVYNGLLKYNERLEIVGELAKSWEISPDGLVMTFHLHPGVRWHDGAPLTARDVRFTYEKLIDPAVATPYSSAYEIVEGLDVVDDLTVRVRYGEPFAPALESWMMGILPEHLLAGEDLNTTRYLRAPVGSGPYRFKRWKTGELIELTANPDYFEHRPFVDRYLYRIIPDQATLFLEVLTGGVDLSGLTPLQYSRQTDVPYLHEHYRTYRYPSFGFTYLGYNLKDPKFSDVRVRRAISLAIDQQALLDGVLFGLGSPATGPYPKESWAYNPDVPVTRRDLARAKALLADAGWADHDGDGTLDRDGEPFSFTLLTNQGNEVRRQVAELVQGQLREAGMDVKIRIIEWSTFVHEFIDKRKFEAVLLGWSLSRDPDLYDLFHSSKTRPGEYNFVDYANPEVDRLLDAGRRTFDQAQRQRIYREIHRILNEDQPYTFLFVPDALPILHARFRNVVPTPIGLMYNLIDWHVPREAQRYKRMTQ